MALATEVNSTLSALLADVSKSVNATADSLATNASTTIASIVREAASKATTTTVKTTTTTATPSSTTTIFTTTPNLIDNESLPTVVIFMSLVMFVVAVAIIVKIIVSHRKKRAELIGGSARWRISASRQSATPSSGGATSASYVPMGTRNGRGSANQQQPLTNGLDTPGPDRLDWERQFFDDTEATYTPSRR